jgi:hypothetical protein
MIIDVRISFKKRANILVNNKLNGQSFAELREDTTISYAGNSLHKNNN